MYTFGIDTPIALVFVAMLIMQLIIIFETYLLYKKVRE